MGNFTAGAVIATVALRDTFTRTQAAGTGLGTPDVGPAYEWTSWDSNFASQADTLTTVNGSEIRIPAGGDSYDSYAGLPHPVHGLIQFDFWVPAVPSEGRPTYGVALGDGADNETYAYVQSDGTDGTYEITDRGFPGLSATFTPTPSSMYRAKSVYNLNTRETAFYVWKVGDPEPTAPLVSGTAGVRTSLGALTGVLDLYYAPDLEPARLDNLTILRIASDSAAEPVAGSFTASAVIEAVVWSDDFSRTVSPGLGTGYTYLYGNGTGDNGAVDGSVAYVNGPNKYTGYTVDALVPRPDLESFTVQFDIWIQAASSQTGFTTYYWFATNHVLTDMYFVVSPVTSPGSFEFEFYDQSVGGWIWYDQNVIESTWYTYKIRRGGGEQKAKLWKRGDPEPDWQLTGGTGPPYPSERNFDPELEIDSTFGEAGKLDNLRIWTFERQPVAGSFTASAWLQRTVPGSLTANAEISNPRAYSVRAIKRKTTTATWTADAIQKKTITSTSGAGAPFQSGAGGGVTFANVTSITAGTNGAVGEEIFVAISFDAQGSSSRTFSPTVGGWTQVIDFKDPSNDGGLVIWRKTMAAGDPTTTTFNISSGAVNAAYAVEFVRGTLGSVIVVTTGVSGGRTTHVSNDIGWDGTLPSLLLFFAAATISSTWTPPSGMTEDIDTTFTFAGIEAAHQNLTPGSSSGGTRTATSSGSSATILATVLIQAPLGGFTADARKAARFFADAVIAATPHFNANAVIRLPTFTVAAWKFKPGITRTFSAAAVIAQVLWDDTFTRARIHGLGEMYEWNPAGWDGSSASSLATAPSWVTGSAADLQTPPGTDVWDSYGGFPASEGGVIQFDFWVPTAFGFFSPYYAFDLKTPSGAIIGGAQWYLAVTGSRNDPTKWEVETATSQTDFPVTPGSWYTAKMTWDDTLAVSYQYVWPRGTQPPASPTFSKLFANGAAGGKPGPSFYWEFDSGVTPTSDPQIDNLRVLTFVPYRRGTFSADAVIGAPFSTFSAKAVIKTTVSEPPVVTFIQNRFGANQATNTNPVTLSLGPRQLASDWTLVLVAKRATSGTTGVLYPEPDSWTEFATAYDAATNVRYHLLRLTDLAATHGFYDASFTGNDWLVVGATYRAASTRAVAATVASTARTTETPLGEVAMPAVSVPSGMVAAFAAIQAAAVGSFTAPGGLSIDTAIAVLSGFGALQGFGLRPATGTVGPFTATYSTPDASPSHRLGYSVGLRVAGGMSANADILAASARVSGAFTAAAYLGAPGGSSSQQHPRGDAFHVEGTYTPADHVLTTQVYGPFPVGTDLQTVLEWSWDQYNTRASSNRIWTAFTAGAIRTQSFSIGSSYANYASLVLADTPAAYFSLGDSAFPLVDQIAAKNATSVGASVAFGVPVIRQGNGITLTAGYAATTFYQPATSEVVIEAWIQTTGTGEIWNGRYSPADGSSWGQGFSMGLGSYGFNTVAGHVSFFLNSDGIWLGRTSDAAVNDGRLHHVVGVWRGTAGQPVAVSQIEIYIDGVGDPASASSTTGGTTAPVAGNSGGATFGGLTYGQFSGSLDELAIYTHALSRAQIAAHYAAGNLAGIRASSWLTRRSTGNFTADAWKRATVAGSYTANAVRLRTTSSSLTAAATALRAQAGSLTGSAVVRRSQAGSFTADTALTGGVTGFSANAVRLATVTGSLTGSAALRTTPSGSWTADARLAGTFTANAIRFKAQAGSLTGDAVLTAGGSTDFDDIYFDTTYFA